MRRVLATVVLVMSAVIGLPATAHAGGPTSVLITHVGASAGALYYTDEAYDDLLALLPPDETLGKAQPPGGVDYNLTWLIHDVMIWRYDHVRVTRDGTAWVTTTFSEDASAGWQQVVPSAKLVEILEAVQGDSAANTASLVPDVEPASTPPAAPPAAADPAWFSLTGWRWVVPGGLLGLLVGGVAARRRRDEEPRRVLISSGA
jgi:hypothetical protein